MNRPSTPRALRRGAWLLLLLVFAVLWFGNLDYRRLSGPDEGRYSEVPREMVATGDWLTPRLNGIKYFEKPPLQYWATATAYEVFGQHQWTVRLWSAVTGVAGVVLTYVAGASLFGAAAGLYAALVLASSLGYAVIANLATLDMGVTLFMTLTLAGILLGLRAGADERRSRAWIYAAWTGMALAVLSKGLIGVVLPAGVVFVYMLAERDFSLLRRLRPVSGGTLFLVIAAPWFVAVSLANPEFFRFFFIHEHFERFLTKSAHRPGAWWYFIPILALGFMPWSTVLADALPRAWRATAPRGAFQPQRFLVIWAGLIFVFFSVSSSKLPSYILPIFPALALLAGLRLTTIGPRALRWHILAVAAAAIAVIATAPIAERFASLRTPAPLLAAYVPWLIGGGAVTLAGAAYAWFRVRASTTAALLALSVATLAGDQLFLMGHNSLAPAQSGYYIAQQIKPYLQPGVPLYSVNTYEQTLPFYIKRTVTLVAFEDEMAYGLAQEPALWIPSYPEFERVWRQQKMALALMPPQIFDELKRAGLPMEVVARDPRRVVVKTPAGNPPGAAPTAPAPGS